MYKFQKYNNFNHNDYAKKQGAKNFWGQIKRTVNAKPVTKKQINLIVNEVIQKLSLKKTDVLLDLGCGNGALTYLLRKKVKKITAVDFSPYLINVAKENFFSKNIDYLNCEIYEFLKKKDVFLYNKILIYGVFPYLSDFKSKKVIQIFDKKFSNLEKVFIGNLPNLENSKKFFIYKMPSKYSLKNHKTSIGIWRSKKEMMRLNKNTNLRFKISNMKKNFYSSDYRFDLTILKR